MIESESFYDAQPAPGAIQSVSDETSDGGSPRFNRRRGKSSNNGRLDRLPPHSLDCEQGVLGCVLLSPNDCLPAVIAKLNSESEAFYDLRHQTIFNALISMFALRAPVDIITLQQWLKDDKQLDEIGGIPYLNSLQDLVPSAANLSYYLELLAEKYLLRKAIQVCTDAVVRAYDCDGDVNALIDGIERDVLSIRKNGGADQSVSVRELVQKAIEEIEIKFQTRGAISGIPTGFIDLDKVTDGLQPGDMTVIAAYPSTGKTALAMNIAENVVLKSELPVGVFSLEMTSVALVKRCLCSCARVNLRAIGEGFMAESDFPKLTSAAGRLSNAKIYFDDTSDLSIYSLRAKARRMWQQFGIKLFVIDYLQLLNASGGSRRVESRQQEVSDISNGIKNMAKEFRVPVIVLSQLNDEGKLRESRSIGQDADGVWKLTEEDGEHVLWIDKQRNGPRKVGVKLTFLKEFTRFESASKISDADVPTDTTDYQPTLPDA